MESLLMRQMVQVIVEKMFVFEDFLNVEDSSKFTRDWFSWADMTYVDLVLESIKYSFK